jgi:hypothetical protein
MELLPPPVTVGLDVAADPDVDWDLLVSVDQWPLWGPTVRRATVDGDGDGDGPALDEHAIVRGGIRTPWVDAPVAALSGLGQPGHLVDLFGSTRAFDAPELARRYPDGREEYVEQFIAATRDAIDAGFVLETDRGEIEALGAAAWPAP